MKLTLSESVKKRRRTLRGRWLRFKGMVRDAYWWVLHRVVPKHRYHTLHLGLKPGYYDIDHRMLHAVFQLYTQYIEEEQYGVAGLDKSIQAWSDDRDELNREIQELQDSRMADETDLQWKTDLLVMTLEQLRHYKELKEIYLYIHFSRPLYEKRIEEKLDKKDYSLGFAMKEERDHNDENVLKRIMEIRQRLWT